MNVRRKGTRNIWVNGDLYVWDVKDESQDEGLWQLTVTADNDWQKQFTYPLTEVQLQQLAIDPKAPPLPEQFDMETMTLRNAITTKEHGYDRHIPATPRLVRMLIDWHIENLWKDSKKYRGNRK